MEVALSAEVDKSIGDGLVDSVQRTVVACTGDPEGRRCQGDTSRLRFSPD